MALVQDNEINAVTGEVDKLETDAKSLADQVAANGKNIQNLADAKNTATADKPKPPVTATGNNNKIVTYVVIGGILVLVTYAVFFSKGKK